MLTIIFNILTSKLVPIVLPPIVSAARAFIVKKLPPQCIPFALSMGGALVEMAATAVGAEVPPNLPELGAAAWDGALLGLATTGLHQLWKQGKEWLEERKQ